MFQALKYVPHASLGVNGELLVVAALGLGGRGARVVLPFLDRGTPGSRRAVVDRLRPPSCCSRARRMTVLALRSGGS